jgi:integrase
MAHNERLNATKHWAKSHASIVRVTWLTLRRTYSSWAHEKGAPGKVIAQLMGHAKVDTTLNVYTQVVDGSLRRAADTVGFELFTIVHKSENAAELTHCVLPER